MVANYRERFVLAIHPTDHDTFRCVAGVDGVVGGRCTGDGVCWCRGGVARGVVVGDVAGGWGVQPYDGYRHDDRHNHHHHGRVSSKEE